MRSSPRSCPDCRPERENVNRRDFLMNSAAGAAGILAAGSLARLAPVQAAESTKTPETLVKTLFDSLKDSQRKIMCFGWDFEDAERKFGLLRTRISNNWNITKPEIHSDFYSAEQQKLIRDIFQGIIQPEWHSKIDKQLQDDAGGYGRQSIAIFGKPGSEKFEFVMTG